MAFNHEQIREAYKRLPEEVQDFVTDGETTDIVTRLLADATLTGEASIEPDSEIMYAMFGLQTLDAAIENIRKISGKPLGDLVNLKSELKSKIFDALPQMMPSDGALPMIIEEGAIPIVAEGKQALLDTIEHPMPAKERVSEMKTPEAQMPTPVSPSASTTSLSPVNLPAAPAKKPINLIDDSLKRVVAAEQKPSSYAGGIDPYREPLI